LHGEREIIPVVAINARLIEVQHEHGILNRLLAALRHLNFFLEGRSAYGVAGFESGKETRRSA
jgi:hypothetical protein